MPDCAEIAEMRKNQTRWLKRKHKIGTWIIRSMAAGKLNTIIEEARANNVGILGVVEISLGREWPFPNMLRGAVDILR